MNGASDTPRGTDDDRPTVETAFRSIAAAVDAVGVDQAPLFLAKLCLLLSEDLGDPARIKDCTARARAGLDAERRAKDAPRRPEGE